MLKIQGNPESAGKAFRLPINFVKKLDRIACINNLSLNHLIIQCLDYALHEIKKDDEKKPQEK